jgi:hypothetical protein
VSLTTLLVAAALVATLFTATAWLAHRRLNGPMVLVAAAEAFVVTLLAALWFGSLGHGGWALLFGMLGLLVSGAERGLRSALLRSAGRGEIGAVLLGIARYLVAGALLAWRLT